VIGEALPLGGHLQSLTISCGGNLNRVAIVHGPGQNLFR
jgi:hypothetical protein